MPHDHAIQLDQMLLPPEPERLQAIIMGWQQHFPTIQTQISPKQLQQLTLLCHMLLPQATPEVVSLAVTQALWIYGVDALVDQASNLSELSQRFDHWQQTTSILPPSDLEGHLITQLSQQLRTQLPTADWQQWWHDVQAFLEAQISQRTQPASSYLAYLQSRTIAQAVPLTITLMALLSGQAEELHHSRTARILWWAGCYIGLINDDSSYDKEVAEGVASSVNARGVIQRLTTSDGRGLDELTSAQFIRRDIQAAWKQLMVELGPQTQWSATDQLILRLALLLRQGHTS